MKNIIPATLGMLFLVGFWYSVFVYPAQLLVATLVVLAISGLSRG